MYRSVIKERARLLRRAIAWLELRGACPPFSTVWSIAQIGFIYTLWRLETGDVPPQAARRDTDDFLSPQDRINSLRFSQTQKKSPRRMRPTSSAADETRIRASKTPAKRKPNGDLHHDDFSDEGPFGDSAEVSGRKKRRKSRAPKYKVYEDLLTSTQIFGASRLQDAVDNQRKMASEARAENQARWEFDREMAISQRRFEREENGKARQEEREHAAMLRAEERAEIRREREHERAEREHERAEREHERAERRREREHERAEREHERAEKRREREHGRAERQREREHEIAELKLKIQEAENQRQLP